MSLPVLFSPLLLLLLGCLVFNFIPSTFAASSFTISYSYSNGGVNEIFLQEGTILDTCTCNATACKMMTADDSGDSEILLTKYVYDNPAECTGTVITSSEIVPTVDAIAMPCSNGEAGSIPTTVTAAISSSTSYSSLAAFVNFAFSSLDDCNDGVYESYVAEVYPTCGGTATSFCNSNFTRYAQSATVLTQIEYFTSACDSPHITETISVPAPCYVPSDDDDDSTDDDAASYRNYETVVLQGPFVSSSGDNTYAVPKGAYVGLIIMVFIAFMLGAAVTYGYVILTAGSAAEQKARLTEAGAAKSTDGNAL